MLTIAFHLHTADNPALSRINPSELSDQQCLELLVEKMHAKAGFQDADGYFLDSTEWADVEYLEDRTMFNINWRGYTDSRRAGGTINLRWIPRDLEIFSATGLRLSGSIETSLLPQKLRSLDVTDNILTGTFDTFGLPRNMQTIKIRANWLSGTISIPGLPPAVVAFWAATNTFSGGLDFSNPPKTLRSVLLQENSFTGPLDLTGIRSMNNLRLTNNCFQQEELSIGMAPMEARFRLHFDAGQFGTVEYMYI